MYTLCPDHHNKVLHRNTLTVNSRAWRIGVSEMIGESPEGTQPTMPDPLPDPNDVGFSVYGVKCSWANHTKEGEGIVPLIYFL
jgi:hypothetical protein